MANYAILGLGMMGDAICYDLLHHEDESKVHLIEIDSERIEIVRQKYDSYSSRLKFHQLSIVTNEVQVKKVLREVDVAFGAIDYRFNTLLTNWCIESNTHYLDLGGNPDVVDEQYKLNDEAKECGITVIPDCGLAPGMVNVLANGLIQKMDTVEECHLRVGGLPQNPTGILQYQQVFSIRGLTNEYIEDAIVIRKGKITTVESLTELETIYFPEPFGQMEAFQTAGGTSSLPRLYEGNIEELTYKTIRYPGHMQYFRFLFDYGLFSDELIGEMSIREIVESKLVEHLPKGQPDVVLIRLQVIGRSDDGTHQSVVWQSIDYADKENDISAMGRTTAYSISIIGQMIASGVINSRGVVSGETTVPFDQFVAELEKRDIVFKENISVLS